MENTKQTARKKYSSRISSGTNKTSNVGSKDVIKSNKNINQNNIMKSTKSIKSSDKNSVKISLKQIQKQKQKVNLSTSQMNLMFSTLFDIDSILQAIIPIKQALNVTPQKNITISLPLINSLIKEYEQIFGRAYSNEIRYYIIATFWDQQLINVGKIQDWQFQIQYQLQKQRKKQNQSQIGFIDAARDQIMKSKISVILNKNVEIQDSKMQKNMHIQLNREIVMAIQLIQQQYYRQFLTLQQLLKNDTKELFNKDIKQQSLNESQKQIQFISKMIGNNFNDLDIEKVGSIIATRYIQKFKIQFNEQQLQNQNKNLDFLIKKLSNNIHMYDKYTNIVGNPTFNSNDPIATRIYIQNIMQLINRVYILKNKNKQNYASVTYNAIDILLKKYQNIKKVVRKDYQNTQKNKLKQRNERVGLIANLQYIRQAANSIVEQSKTNGHEFKFLHNQLISQYQTHKNQCDMFEDNQPTFRNKGRQSQNMNKQEQTAIKQKNVYISNQQFQQNIQKLKTQQNKQSYVHLSNPTILRQKFFQQKSNQINKNKIHPYKLDISQTPEKHSQQFSNKNTKKIPIRQYYQQNSPYINAFRTYPEPFQIRSNHKIAHSNPFDFQMRDVLKEKQISSIHRQQYDNLLRQRILNQMKIVELERIRNRIKCYDIIYK